MRSTPSIAQLETDLRSDQQETRGRAMQCLLLIAKKDSSVHAAALPLFQTMLVTAPDPWTVSSAARGIELIRGPEEGRQAWLTLMNHPDGKIASSAAMTVDATAYIPELMQILTTRPEPGVRISVIRALGRTKNPNFLATILPYLDVPEARTHAILALEQLEDPRALPNLEPLIQDNSDSGMTDDRGCPLRIGDLAASATRRLQYVSGKPYSPVTTPAREISVTPRSDPKLPSALPPVAKPAVSVAKKFRLPLSLLVYIPLIAALLEIPWVAMLIFAQLFLTGAVARTRFQTHFLDAASLIPPLIGLAAALFVVARGPAKKRVEIICLSLGTVACALMGFPFACELLN